MAIDKKVFIPVALTKTGRKKQQEKMRGKLESSGWLIKEYFDGGMSRSSYFIVENSPSCPDAKLPSSLHVWQKGLIFAIGLIIILALFLPRDPENKTITETTAVETQKPNQAQQDDQQSDKNRFLSYYRELMVRVNEADSMYEPFRVALQKGDTVEATSIALRIKTPIQRLWLDIRELKTPNLQNKDAKKKLDQAKDAISGSYLHKADSVEGWIKFAETQDMKTYAELKNKAEDMKTLLYGGIAYLNEAGSMLGVDLANIKK